MNNSTYTSPRTDVLLLVAEDVICGTGQVKFGTQNNSAGYVDNSENVDGGDF
jgi:hypothetical protein